AYLDRWQPWLQAVSQDLAPELGEAAVEFLSGWRREEVSLIDALLLSRQRDLSTGFTSVGPHRADWKITYARLPPGADLSRGQGKLSALSSLLAQAEQLASELGDWPVIALDDPASELDLHHQRQVLQRLMQSNAQVFLSGTQIPSTLSDTQTDAKVFHVEHGMIQSI
ncbi:MAG: DNA replication and repair protein RecF, partial [Luteimonas sp.]